jgi:2',3'-cyclic-nucleotide 2'-phosphodiesterase (5'-nucleotidase family)
VVRTVLVSLGLLVGVTSTPLRAQEHTTLTVLYTSDVHARALPIDYVRQRPARGSLAQVATLVKRVRSENPLTVVLDGGDAIQGTPLGHYALSSTGVDEQNPIIAAMNIVAYDAAVVGNHEFNYGLDALRRSLGQARFPWLAANVRGVEAAKLPLGDELVIERSGVKIGILGLANANTPHWDPPAHWRGLSFLDAVETARVRLGALRARADVVIVVAHTGFERDLDSGESNGSEHENFGCRLAELDGIDLLLTGHTHRNLAPQRIGKTWTAQPGRWAEQVTRFDLTLEKSASGWRVSEVRGNNLATAELAVDPVVAAAVEPANARTERELNRQVAELAAPLVLAGAPVADDASIDLVHAVQLEATGAQLSLASPLGSGRTEFPAGAATPRLAHALYPYSNTLVVVQVTGAQLDDILEHAVRGWQGVDCQPATGCALTRDTKVATYNFDTLQGATYLVDPTRPAGDRVFAIRVTGAEVMPAQSFSLVVNSYRAVGGGGYPHLETAPRIKEIDRTMVELLVAYLGKQQVVTPKADRNWAFVLPLRDATGAASRNQSPGI